MLVEYFKGNIQLVVVNVVLEFKRELDFRVMCIYMRFVIKEWKRFIKGGQREIRDGKKRVEDLILGKFII